jgi:hydroxyacylglutathione hydrolase
VIPDDVDIVLVVNDGFELEAKNRLARIGFDHVAGFLHFPMMVMADNPDRVVRLHV